MKNDMDDEANSWFKPVGIVKRHTGDLKDMAIIVWTGDQPPEGEILYMKKAFMNDLTKDANNHAGTCRSNAGEEYRRRSRGAACACCGPYRRNDDYKY